MLKPQILDVANYVRDEDGKVPWRWQNLAELGRTWQNLAVVACNAWHPEVLKDGAAVPAPGAGDALVLQISCNEVRTRTRTDKKGDLIDVIKVDIGGLMTRTKHLAKWLNHLFPSIALQVGRVLGRGGETIRRLEDQS